MKSLKYTVLVLILIPVLQSCYNYRSVGLLQERVGLPSYPKVPYQEYRLQINDEIIFRMFTSDQTISKLIQSDISPTQSMFTYRIFPDGTIDLPFVKGIKILGMTMVEASLAVQHRMREIIPDAEIKLSISNKTFTVIGDAGTGVFNIPRERFTIYQALSISGELKHTGDHQRVRIMRESANGTKILEFDIRPKSLLESEFYYIYPNDIIYVQRSKAAFYKIENSLGNFMSTVTSTLSLLFTVLYSQR